MSSYTFTSESVTEGHPDKMADQVSDAVLDAILAEAPNGRVACETLLTTGLCVVAGEITTSAYVDIPKLAREVIRHLSQPEIRASMADEMIYQTFLNRSDDFAELRAARAQGRDPRFTGS